MAMLTIMGLRDYYPTVFDNMVFPDDWTTDEKNMMKDLICLECAELELVYPDGPWMKNAIGLWSKSQLFVWNRINTLAKMEYNPIENYDRYEDTTITDDNSITNSGTDSTTDTTKVTNSGTDTITNKVTGFDSNTLVTRESSDNVHGHVATNSGGVSMTHGHKQDIDNERTIDGHIHGNIGVTTTQQMMQQELDIVAKVNLPVLICDSFRDRFCLQVY